MPIIDKKYQYIIDIVDKYNKVELDEILEDEEEIEIHLFPSNFKYEEYYSNDNSEYLNECEQIRQDIVAITKNKVECGFDKENSWQFIYIIKGE